MHNSVSALKIALTFRFCKDSTVQFKCQVQDGVFQFCGKEFTFKGMSLLPTKVNSFKHNKVTPLSSTL